MSEQRKNNLLTSFFALRTVAGHPWIIAAVLLNATLIGAWFKPSCDCMAATISIVVSCTHAAQILID